MLNPSTADAEKNDATIRKVIGFSQRWGYAAAEVVNLYAYRARNPKDLRAAEAAWVDVIGPDNGRHLVNSAYGCDRVVVAWGAHEPASSKRTLDVYSALSERGVWCLGMSQSGQPRHPLTLAYSIPLEPWGP